MKTMLFVLCLLLVTSPLVVGQNNPVDVEPDTSEEVIFVTPERMPEYPEGHVALIQYMASIILPDCGDALEVPGKLYISFVIDTAGNVTQVEIAKSSGDDCLDEAYLKHLCQMPRWKPGQFFDKIVSIKMTLPINICWQ